ncbi:Retrovirus-related Pol polyprotein from transposon TNT 1-94 [Sesamum angolense]|uniref:Retrovirus-related Pol polyprotein from transposon TNT 1-94 n=1 Tax=Sesamum angolense TaxID=2727404 RepID=A0AAE1X0H7_9LAMI|nr:Retrovirus-related Pol polyprotein from transposon TNT 1-94 [Sesamum angolense]
MAMAQEARSLQLPRLKKYYQKKMMTDLPQIQAIEGACEACLQGKQHKKPFPSRTSWRAKAVLELIHTDVCGPMRTPSHEQNRYFILFIDDYSRMTWVYFMREKSEVFKVFKKFKNLVEKQSGRSIKVLRSDRGKEYNNSEFDKFCEEEGIEHQTTVSYNPQQNGVSERKNRTVMEMARSMLQEKHLPKAFWAEAVYTAVYLLNRCPTKAVQNMTPIEAWSGKKPSAKHLRVFGSICYVHIPTEKRHKLEEKTEKGIFLGYSTQSKGYRIYNLKTKKLIISRDVEFDEDAMWNWDEEKVEIQSVMIPKETPPQQQQEEGTDQAEMERRSQQAPGSPRRPPSSEEIEEETPPRRTKLLSDIYETCNFIMLEPENFETAVKHKVWASKKQATVAQSSAEAEYIAAAATSSIAIWLRRILEDMGEKQEEPTTIYCDNKSAIAITKNPVQHSRTKHIDIKYHSLREATTRGEIELKYCSTEEQLADIFTKALPQTNSKNYA